MAGRAAWETRVAALLEARSLLLAAVSLGAVVFVGIASRTGNDDAAEAVATVLVGAGLLLAPVVTHGAVSSDLRSGVALLWLQKPVNAVRFYLTRGLDVVSLAVLLSVVLQGGAALLAALLTIPEVGHEVLRAMPLTVLFTCALATLVFAFSSWGTALDALLGFFVFYLSGLAVLDDGPLRMVTGWVGFPLEAVATLGRFFSTGDTASLWPSLARFTGFLAAWTCVAAIGIAFRTRSPLPHESSR